MAPQETPCAWKAAKAHKPKCPGRGQVVTFVGGCPSTPSEAATNSFNPQIVTTTTATIHVEQPQVWYSTATSMSPTANTTTTVTEEWTIAKRKVTHKLEDTVGPETTLEPGKEDYIWKSDSE